jgi:hypothetical protein
MYMTVTRCRCLCDACMLWVVDVILIVIVQYFNPLLHFRCRDIVDTKSWPLQPSVSVLTRLEHTRTRLYFPFKSLDVFLTLLQYMGSTSLWKTQANKRHHKARFRKHLTPQTVYTGPPSFLVISKSRIKPVWKLYTQPCTQTGLFSTCSRTHPSS